MPPSFNILTRNETKIKTQSQTQLERSWRKVKCLLKFEFVH